MRRLAACATAATLTALSASAQTQTQAQTTAPPQQTAPPPASATAVQRPQLQNLQRVAPPRVAPVRGIDWKAVQAFQRTNDARQSPASRILNALKPEAVDATSIPILLPEIAALRDNVRIYSFGEYYSISFELPQARVSLTGNGRPIAFAAKSRLTAAPEGDTGLTLQRTVDGRVASWTRFGVLYTAEVTCDFPAAPACRDDGFLRDLVQRHQGVVLGRAARKAAGFE